MINRFLKPQYLVLILILGIGFYCRASLLDFGLPYFLYEDEPIYFTKMMAFGYGDWDPDYFKKPTFFLYAHFVVAYLYYWLGQFSNWQAFEHYFWLNPTILALLGRSCTLVFSIGSIYWLYRLGKKVISPSVGLIAAFLLAIHTTPVKYTPIVIADIPAVFFILLTAWFSLKIYDKGRWKDYVATALCIALTMSFKYNFFVVTFLITAHALRYGQNTAQPIIQRIQYALQDRKFWSALAVAGGCFVALSPYVLINFSRFYEHFAFEKDHVLQRTMQTERSFKPFVSLGGLLFKIIPRDLSWPIYAMSLLGLTGLASSPLWPQRVAVLREKLSYPHLLILFSFPMVFLMVISQFRLVTAKYSLPITPFWMLAAASVLVALVTLITHKLKQSNKKPVICSLLMLLLTLGSSYWLWKDTAEYVSVWQKPTTLILAQDHLKTLLKPGERLMLEKYTFPAQNIPVIAHQLSGRHVFQLGDPETTADYVKRIAPDYVLMNPTPIKDPDGNKMLYHQSDYYDYLRQHFEIVDIITPYGLVLHSDSFPRAFDGEISAQSIREQDYLDIYLTLDKNRKKTREGSVLFLLKALKFYDMCSDAE